MSNSAYWNTTGAVGTSNSFNIPATTYQPSVYYYPQPCNCNHRETIDSLERIITKLIDKLVTAEQAKTGISAQNRNPLKETRKEES